MIMDIFEETERAYDIGREEEKERILKIIDDWFYNKDNDHRDYTGWDLEELKKLME